MEAAPTQPDHPSSSFGQLWHRVPATYFLLILVLCGIFRDTAFPFSNFPMYSALGKKAAYVYVTDGKDQPLGILTQFAERSSNVSKAFRTNLDKVAKENGRKRKNAIPADYEAAGRLTLARLEFEGRARRPEVPRTDELKLWYVEISRDKKTLKEKPTFAGSIRADEVEKLAAKSSKEEGDADVD